MEEPVAKPSICPIPILRERAKYWNSIANGYDDVVITCSPELQKEKDDLEDVVRWASEGIMKFARHDRNRGGHHISSCEFALQSLRRLLLDVFERPLRVKIDLMEKFVVEPVDTNFMN